MNEVFTDFCASFPDINAVGQEPSMTEEKKEEFLALFRENPEETLVAFCVLGGVFSEGIDLKGNRLIGSVIVSVGLPQLGTEPNIIRDYFDAKNGMGYKYAYMYPGMNKVLQAAGRVIRCESDRGSVLLIDERFGSYEYKKLFPQHWENCRRVRDAAELEKALDGFWEKS
jgi:Rad3-related DNA helicase